MNDQDKLKQEIEKLEIDTSNRETKLEELSDKVYEEEEFSEGEEEETTMLAKYLRSREEAKNSIARDFDEKRDKTILTDERKDQSLKIQELKALADMDKETLDQFLENAGEYHESLFEAIDLYNETKNHAEKASSLLKEWHSCDLPPINQENNNANNEQPNVEKRSLIDDYADLSTEPADYTGGDD